LMIRLPKYWRFAKSAKKSSRDDISDKMRLLYSAVTAALLLLSEICQSILLASTTSAGFSEPKQSYSAQENAICVDSLVHIPANANNTKILLSTPCNNLAVTEFYAELTQANSNLDARAVGGTNAVSGTYSIYTRLCLPVDLPAAKKVTTIQILTYRETLNYIY